MAVTLFRVLYRTFIQGTKAGDDLIEPKQNQELEKNLKRLHDNYNALMDRYRRLKQMAQTPERDQEIDNLVRVRDL